MIEEGKELKEGGPYRKQLPSSTGGLDRGGSCGHGRSGQIPDIW